MHVPHDVHRWSPVELLLTVCNPMRVASFTMFFGLCGRLAQLFMPWLGPLTLIIAVISGFVSSNLVMAFFGFMYTRFQSTSMSVVGDLIGHMAEVTVPVSAGKVGEITYIVESKRYTSSARAVNPAKSFNKGDKVMITNIENAVSYIEPWDDAFIDPQFDTEVINVGDANKVPESS
jgi:membrane protein implicated in regulation of membrane protease activity